MSKVAESAVLELPLYAPRSVAGAKQDGKEKDVAEWTTHDVARWLNSLGLGRHAAAFATNVVTGDVLHMLQEEHFREMGVEKIGERVLLGKEVLRLQDAAVNRKRFGVTWEADAVMYHNGPWDWCWKQATCFPCCEDVDHYKLTGAYLYVTERDLKKYKGACCATSKYTRSIDLTTVAGVSDFHRASACDCGCAADDININLNQELGLADPMPLKVPKGQSSEIVANILRAVEDSQMRAPQQMRVYR